MTPSARAIEERYGFRIDTIVPLPDTDRAWRVQSDRGPLVLRLHGKERFASHAGEIGTLRFLEERDYPAPRLVLAADGSVLGRWGEKEGYLTTFVTGDQPLPSIDAAWQLGAATGRLHALDSQGMNLPKTLFTVPAERESFHRLDADPTVRAWEGYSSIRQVLVRAWEHLPDLIDVPQALVHTDVLFQNAVQTPSGQVVLIDWDDAGLGPAIQDLGYLLANESIPLDGTPIQSDTARAILDGYQTERPLDPIELLRLPDAMLFGAIVYVLAPWESRVWMGLWKRALCILNHRSEIVSLLGENG